MTNPFATTLPPEIVALQTAVRGQPLRAFHGSQAIADFYRARALAHQKADEIAAGHYVGGNDHTGYSGCAVGCTIHGGNHAAYETEIGIPRVLARIEDGIFEALASADFAAAKTWPVSFLSAPKVGADLTMVWPRFAYWMLMDPDDGVIKFAKDDKVKATIKAIAMLYYRWIGGEKPPQDEWFDADYAANAASAAANAAANATSDSVLDAAAYAAYAVDSDYTPTVGIRSACIARKKQASMLLQLMREAD